MKNRIRLNEAQLHRVIKESVRRVMDEGKKVNNRPLEDYYNSADSRVNLTANEMHEMLHKLYNRIIDIDSYLYKKNDEYGLKLVYEAIKDISPLLVACKYDYDAIDKKKERDNKGRWDPNEYNNSYYTSQDRKDILGILRSKDAYDSSLKDFKNQYGIKNTRDIYRQFNDDGINGDVEYDGYDYPSDRELDREY